MAEERFDPDDDRSKNGDSDVERGPLAERLRNLRWPSTEEDHAKRSWEQFQRRLAEREKAAPPAPDDDESA